MDYDDIIKLEQQSPIYSTDNHCNSIKQCMASFYDHDSDTDRKENHQLLIHNHHSSFQNAINLVQNYIDIIDTPIEEIIKYLDNLQCIDGLDKNLLRKKILKRKNLLKRYRAKNRQPKIICYEQQYPIPSPISLPQNQTQIKKKRNRVSAQISRDRKKLYFKDLQEKNQQLQQQIIRTTLQNQKLKRQMQDPPIKTKSSFYSDTLNNKLTRLLIFLGIIFLIGILKETFLSANQNISKLKVISKIQEMNNFGKNHHCKMIEEGQRKVAQFLQEPQLQRELMDNEERKVQFQVDSGSYERKRNIFSGLIEKLFEMKQVVEKINVEL